MSANSESYRTGMSHNGRITIAVSPRVHQTITEEAVLEGVTPELFALEATLFRVAYQHAERGDSLEDELRRIWTYLYREELHGREASDRLRHAVKQHCRDDLESVIRKLEEWDPPAATTARRVYGIADGKYTPEEAGT